MRKRIKGLYTLKSKLSPFCFTYVRHTKSGCICCSEALWLSLCSLGYQPDRTGVVRNVSISLLLAQVLVPFVSNISYTVVYKETNSCFYAWFRETTLGCLCLTVLPLASSRSGSSSAWEHHAVTVIKLNVQCTQCMYSSHPLISISKSLWHVLLAFYKLLFHELGFWLYLLC